MSLTPAGSVTLWVAVAVLSLLSLPELSLAQQAPLSRPGGAESRLSLATLPELSRAQQAAFDQPSSSESQLLALPHPAGSAKRSFLGLRCRGVYDRTTFGELESVCQECFALYWEPELLGLCRSQCFTTDYFGGCLQALQRDHQADRLGAAIRRISGRR